MLEKLSIRIITNNAVNESGLRAEHGLSLLIRFVVKGEKRTILFDTGQSGDVLTHNLEKLKINLEDLITVVISHGHYDHTGGLLTLLKMLNRKVPVIVHPDAWGPRISPRPYFRSIGSGLIPADIEKEGGEIIAAANPVYLTEEILTTGTIDRVEPLEQNFIFQRTLRQDLVSDEILDDLSIVINLNGQGLFLVTGCCHAGIINTVKHAVNITNNERIRGIIGGLHLIGAGQERIQRTAEFLQEVNPEIVIPLHCTGMEESSFLRMIVGDSVTFMGVGEEISVL